MSRQHLLESRQALSLALESSALARAMCSLAERCHCVEELRLVRIRERFSCAFRAKPSSFSHRAVLLSLARMFPRGRRVVPRSDGPTTTDVDDVPVPKNAISWSSFLSPISPSNGTTDLVPLRCPSHPGPSRFSLTGPSFHYGFTENRAFKAIFAGKSGQL